VCDKEQMLHSKFLSLTRCKEGLSLALLASSACGQWQKCPICDLLYQLNSAHKSSPVHPEELRALRSVSMVTYFHSGRRSCSLHVRALLSSLAHFYSNLKSSQANDAAGEHIASLQSHPDQLPSQNRGLIRDVNYNSPDFEFNITNE